ncbi:putative GPI anchored endo-1,3(4)-beta-glucanase [Aspergillus stella-maris]|uniref:putative GPI anchored endo-1,3(4)-beta-glucanase n=1 Tax=Aspergillus stella-maris TaxID=1810926 RepID=UPI003CCE3697
MSSSTLMRRVGSLAASALIFPSIAHATGSYTLQQSFEGENILDHFNFFDQADPTNGFVTYVNQSYAQDAGLVKITDSGSLYLGVDYETVLSADGPGRESVRIESNEYYDQGLYVIDIQHMPGSICGTWPAFWTVGPNWPDDGEIDIIEGVNKHDSNKIVLHTSGSCDVGGDHDMSGDMTSSECGDASGTIGCVVEGQQGSSGDPFNKANGGVYAMEWQKEYLKIWFFPRSSIPTSLTEGKPDTSAFGTPMAHLQGSCNFEERFTHQKMILDTTFCGDWAGGVFGDSGCPVKDPSNPIQSCVNYVAENPAAFENAFWELNSIKIYQLGGSTEAQGTQDAATSTKTTTSAAEPTATSTHTSVETTAVETTTSAAPETTVESVATAQTTTEAAVEPTTTAAPATASNVQGANSQSTSKSTRFVTVTTTLCPSASAETANAVSVPETSSKPAGEIAEIPASTPAAASAPAPEPETATAAQPAVTAETSVDAVGSTATCDCSTIVEETTVTAAPVETHAPASVETPAPVETPAAVNTPAAEPSSIPPDSVIYTAPEETTSAGWTIISTSSQFISPTESSPSGVDATGSPTTPSSPIFTGMGSKLSISASAIVGAVAMLILV